MWYVAGFCALVVLSATAGLTRSRTETAQKNIESPDSPLASSVVEWLHWNLIAMSPAEINILLARLETEDTPEITMGAMCYDIAAPQAITEYVCPVCGEKTLYNVFLTPVINSELEGCRRMAESINKYTDFEVTLDEGLFCDFCSPDTGDQDPSLLLRVLHENGVEVLNEVSITDLRMLDSFLQGNLYYMDEYDARYPLNEFSDRMRELLGVEAE